MSEVWVWVLRIETRYGPEIGVYATREGARAELAKCVRSWWDEIVGCGDAPDTPPADDDEAIETYFELNGREAYSIDCARSHPW